MKSELQKSYLFYEALFRKNTSGYLKHFMPYIIVFLFAAGVDFLSTSRFMLAGSVDDEFHPIIRLVSQLFGPIFGPLIGKLAQIFVVIVLSILFRPFAKIIFIPISILYFYAAWHNTVTLD